MSHTPSHFQVAGLASNFDWQAFLDQIATVQRAPINRLNAEKTRATAKLGALSTVATNLTTLQASANALAVDGLFGGRKAVSNTANSTWTPTAATDTAAGTYQFAVTQLATNSRRDGAADIAAGLSTTSDVSGVTLATMPTAVAVTAGTFTVAGQSVTVATSDSLQTIFDRIATATGSDVTAAYDAGTDKVTLTKVSAGELVLGAANDTSNFLQVMQLANNGTLTTTSSGALGTLRTTGALNAAGLRTAVTAVDGSGNGTFSVNGVAIAYNFTTESLTTVLKRITDSTAGVTASYDATADRVTLTNKSTGDLGVTVSETGAGLAAALGLVTGSALVRGKNATFTVNGGATLTSTSNTLTAAAHGITGLSVTANTVETQTIQVTSDTGTMRAAISKFLTDFNAVQTYIDSQTKITTDPTTKKVVASVLTDNREVQAWADTLRSTAFASVTGLSGAINRLEHLGIDFKSGTSELEIEDSAKLDAALASSPADVKAFFGTATTGLAAKLNTFITATTATGGSLPTQQNTLTAGNTSIDSQIADIQRRLDQQREVLTNAFIAMETAQSKFSQQAAQLTNSFFSTK
ncbi:MAG: flagellar filament capping protein FliD [Opitutae bacterium]|nr:flagellar filament capping protein FliD [Opitutae bacterium]